MASTGNMKSCFSNHTATLSSLSPTTGSTTFTSLQQYANMVTLAIKFALNAMISLKDLLLVLVSIIAHIVFEVQLLTITLTSASVVAALTAHKIHEAYNAFMALSQGSVPTNGFMRDMQIAQQNVTASGTGYLSSLSFRPDSTPYVVGTAPHRQINQTTPEGVLSYWTTRMASFASLKVKSSNSSTKTTTTTRSSSCSCPAATGLRTVGCNICCPHGSDCRSHVVLHPCDVETVVQNGWGELHPHANTGSYFAPSDASCYMPATLALIYAPRIYPEVSTVMKIVKAGSRYLNSLGSQQVVVCQKSRSLYRSCNGQHLSVIIFSSGGISGMSTLKILEDVMERIRRGTNTGVVIVIMLGRLGMSVGDTVQAYRDLGRKTFTPTRCFYLIKDQCQEEDKIDTSPTLFRTYDDGAAFANCDIWQVPRSTSAAATFFKSIEYGRDDVKFINPVSAPEILVLGMGTGLGDVVEIKDIRAVTLSAPKNVASESNKVANRGVLLADWEKLSKILDPKDRPSWQTTSPARISSDVTLADIRFTVRHDQEVRREGRLDQKTRRLFAPSTKTQIVPSALKTLNTGANGTNVNTGRIESTGLPAPVQNQLVIPPLQAR
ncbi:hypothetical protein Q7P36_010597 [Cladosporium allicinum]